jgi:hypothetical protein
MNYAYGRGSLQQPARPATEIPLVHRAQAEADDVVLAVDDRGSMTARTGVGAESIRPGLKAISKERKPRP